MHCSWDNILGQNARRWTRSEYNLSCYIAVSNKSNFIDDYQCGPVWPLLTAFRWNTKQGQGASRNVVMEAATTRWRIRAIIHELYINKYRPKSPKSCRWVMVAWWWLKSNTRRGVRLLRVEVSGACVYDVLKSIMFWEIYERTVTTMGHIISAVSIACIEARLTQISKLPPWSVRARGF